MLSSSWPTRAAVMEWLSHCLPQLWRWFGQGMGEEMLWLLFSLTLCWPADKSHWVNPIRSQRQGDMGDTLLEVSSSTHTAEKTRTERTENESRGIEWRLICIIPFFSFQKIYILKRNINGAKGFHLHLSLSHLAVWKSNTLQ